ncbi:MAG: substrate-binding domain-containing protein [Salinisphaera sp.]|nr:substrate-binding domain-containing protein [Salinisphaera sp.]
MTVWFLRRHPAGRPGRLLLGAVFAVVTTLGAPAWAKAGDGTVTVFYPDSMVQVMQHGIVPAFEQATGHRVAGHHARSLKLASEIRAKAHAADVLITTSPRVNLELMGPSHGNWVDWYALFMQSPLVVGYDPESSFANELKSKPWYKVATESDFRLGLTNPDTDPKGRLTAKALDRVVNIYDQQNLEEKLAANCRIVAAQDLIDDLQTQQLDAAFLYQSEAVSAGIPFVPLKLGNISATYTVTVLNNAPHPGPASAFVAFLLSEKGKQILTQSGSFELTLAMPVFGSTNAVPAALKPVLRRQ